MQEVKYIGMCVRYLYMLQKHIKKSKPVRNDLTDKEYKKRVKIWDKYISSGLKESDFTCKQKSDEIHLNGESVKNNNEFSFKISISENIETSSGIAKNCELVRISLAVFPWSKEKIHVLYDAPELPKGRRDNKFAKSEKTNSKILVIYDLQSDTKINTCLLLDRTNLWDTTSKNTIPLLERK